MTTIATTHDAAALFDEARAAGMTAEQAGRWVAYVAMKRAAGEEPIPLATAVHQLTQALRTHASQSAAALYASIARIEEARTDAASPISHADAITAQDLRGYLGTGDPS